VQFPYDIAIWYRARSAHTDEILLHAPSQFVVGRGKNPESQQKATANSISSSSVFAHGYIAGSEKFTGPIVSCHGGIVNCAVAPRRRPPIARKLGHGKYRTGACHAVARNRLENKKTRTYALSQQQHTYWAANNCETTRTDRKPSHFPVTPHWRVGRGVTPRRWAGTYRYVLVSGISHVPFTTTLSCIPIFESQSSGMLFLGRGRMRTAFGMLTIPKIWCRHRPR
jgi:hypothetical protein